jgi:hypothetical protein
VERWYFAMLLLIFAAFDLSSRFHFALRLAIPAKCLAWRTHPCQRLG